MNVAENSVDRRAAYQRAPSLISELPWLEFDDKDEVCLLQDGKSLGAGLTLSAVQTEGMTQESVAALSRQLANALQNAIPAEADNPYTVQCFIRQERLSHLDLQKHIATNTAFSKTHLDIMREHIRYLNRPAGSFYDYSVTDSHFVAKTQEITLFIYRYRNDKSRHHQHHQDEYNRLNTICSRLAARFKLLGLEPKRLQGKDLYHLLLNWFNPKDGKTLEKNFPYPKTPSPYWDFTESLFHRLPKSEQGYWCFDGIYHSMLALQGLSADISAGQISKERKQARGDKSHSALDGLPIGSIVSMTFVICADKSIKTHLKKVAQSAKGKKPLAKAVSEQVMEANNHLAQGGKIYPMSLHVFLQGDSIEALTQHEEAVCGLFAMEGIRLMPAKEALAPLSRYLNQLPMNYDYQLDKAYLSQSQLYYLEDIAKLLPVYGRNRGTDNANFVFFNRGGEPVFFDPLKDSENASHLFLLGNTGTGKSNLLASMIASTIATHNPRVVILEAGGSFDLLADFCKAQGKRVNHIDFTHPISLNPFSEAMAAYQQFTETQAHERAMLESLYARLDDEVQETVEPEVSRESFTEMALALRLMITGGNEQEEIRFSRQDGMLIMDALYLAAKTALAEGKPQVILSDILQALETMCEALDASKEGAVLNRLQEFHHNLRYFTHDLKARTFFNRPGKPWPDKDITLVNLQKFVDDDEQSALYLALAVIGCLSKVMSLAQENAHSGRDTVLIIDEAHVLIKNPIICNILVLVAKMARKFGLWLWVATQHVRDFKDDASKILSMLETWICLSVDGQAQIDEIKRFKTLSPQDEAVVVK